MTVGQLMEYLRALEYDNTHVVLKVDDENGDYTGDVIDPENIFIDADGNAVIVAISN